MSSTLRRVKKLVQNGDIRISEHGYDELLNDGLAAREIVERVPEAMLVEDYPGYPKGSCVLVLQQDKNGDPIHVVWGIPKGHGNPAVLVTAYRPDPRLWDKTFMRRKK